MRALAAFGDEGINLTKLETYMASKERRKPTFYVDVGEHLYASRMIAAMAAFSQHVERWKVLGTYPASPQRGIVSGFLTIEAPNDINIIDGSEYRRRDAMAVRTLAGAIVVAPLPLLRTPVHRVSELAVARVQPETGPV